MPVLFIFYLGLPLTANSFHLFFYLPGLTSDCQFGLRFDFVAHVYLIGLTPLMPNLLRFFENPDLSELPSSFRRSFWSFYRVQDPFSFCIPISNKKTNIWCNVSCNVWLCTNEMFEHFLNSFSSFFIFPRFNECEMQMSYANAMIGLTDALCTIVPQYVIDRLLTTDLDVDFLMNANKMWCKSRFFISDANASWRRCKCNFLFMMQMSHAGMKMQSLFMMILVNAFKPWCKYLLTKMEMRMSSNGYVMMQMSLCRNAMMKMF